MQGATTGYGRLGIDVGAVGRWSRLAFGVVILLPVVGQLNGDLRGDGESVTFYLRAGAYLAAIAAGYVVLYRTLSTTLLNRTGPWTNTAIFVGPAFTAAWWNVLLEPTLGAALPADLTLAVGVYIGLSFLLQWRIGYGGCEVVSLPIALGAPRRATYCVPLVAADAVEKRLVDRSASGGLEPGRREVTIERNR